ncbi:hypothetical protein [Actinoplanes xinjiangensis]|uniref:Uncharacterized protein n=1 Tax=Actinoplanes xinjiangensis TaxID=512350 RepID=A0A316EFP2_9ACTN|nr:hypothetical protein [Actinoplanes xinjiangensis]PWK30168.1 hypothetical protein BC793_14022 [Actinoplanes xinjiangensis]GIF44596.1 hypothetical protein Axi01nite_89070 [Actinoplanes xinjiangensis]
MKVLKLAAGFAVGYVVGSRAGREKYEQIAAYARKTSSHPTVVQAQEKAKGLLSNGSQAVVAKLPHADSATSGKSGSDSHTTSRPAAVSPSPATPSSTSSPVTPSSTSSSGTSSTSSPARPPKPARTTPSTVGGDPLA